ncbi:hypothetical protein YC2023_115004 [Brassica napus]
MESGGRERKVDLGKRERERFGSTDAANIFVHPSFRFGTSTTHILELLVFFLSTGLIHVLSIWQLNLLKKLQAIRKVASSPGNK